jgi:hypothetical protein
MLPSRLRVRAVAAWLGVIALGLNALVPIHLAFDLAHALAPERHGENTVADHDLVGCLLTLVTGHHDENEDHSSPDKEHHHQDCPVCGAIGTLAGFAPAAVVLPAIPVDTDGAAFLPTFATALHIVPLAAYRSRAPPIA